MVRNGSHFPPTNIPIPDPSILTTQSIALVKGELRTEFIDKLKALGDLMTTRISAMDTAAQVLNDQVHRIPLVMDREIGRLEKTIAERFASIDTRLAERDARFRASEVSAKDATNSLSTSSNAAVTAALQAQKELSYAIQQANTEAIRKSEAGFSNEITALKSLINATKEGLTAALSELRSRIDRGEGGHAGVRNAREDTNMTVSTVVGIIGGVTGVLSLLAVLILGVVNLNRTPPPSAIVARTLVPEGPLVK